jgi:hypothetical protein
LAKLLLLNARRAGMCIVFETETWGFDENEDYEKQTESPQEFLYLYYESTP